MKNIKFISASFVAAVACVSCSQEELANNSKESLSESDSRLITLEVSCPGAITRGETVGDNLDYCKVTCFNLNNPKQGATDNDAVFNPMFSGKEFRSDGTLYTAAETFWPIRGTSDFGKKDLVFLGYYPALTDVEFINNSRAGSDGSFSIVDSIKGFKVNPDISKQIDFVTASGIGHIPAGENDPVVLDFNHQLSAIELKVQGENRDYDIEIAGVQIGNAIVEGNYIYEPMFKDDGEMTSVGNWQENHLDFRENYHHCKIPGKVAYLYQEGESPVKVSNSPVSIMGKSGYAMVIPNRCKAWDNKGNPTAGPTPDKYGFPEDGGSYFAVLLRVTEKESGDQVYPYTDKSLPYGYVSNGRTKVTLGGKDFGWAAMPVKSEWQPGKKYSYTLDFSKGVGVIHPEDPNPGKPIISNDHIEITLKIYDWVYENITLTPDFEEISNK